MRNTNGLEFDPYDYYKGILKQEVNDKSTELIENVTKNANIDLELNKKLAKETQELEKKIAENNSKKNISNVIGTILIVLGIVGIIAAIYGVYKLYLHDRELSSVLALVIGLIVAIVCFVLYFAVLRKNVNKFNNILSKLNKEYNNKKNEAWQTLSTLRNNLNFKQYVDFVNSLNTTIKLDYEVDRKKVLILTKAYNLNFDFGDYESILDIYSGTIDSNPFVRVLLKKEEMRNTTYTGTRVVTWTERVRDSKGHTRTVTRSQTLVANYTAPAPYYQTYSLIIYGNGAAPKLTFSRYPSGLPLDHDEKDVEKLVKKRTADLEELTEKAIKEGKTFTTLANNDFDALFYAIDRNNETEFRLLFTPLAQQNMVELITATDTYGDDFTFIKRNKLNFVSSNHANSEITFNYNKYLNYYDYELLKKDYINDLNSSFYSLYFDLAPILAIPLYQMNEAPLIDEDNYKQQITLQEAEAFVNHMNLDLFRHKATATDQILKLKRINNYNNTDTFNVTSHSFSKFKRTTLVAVPCQNGRIYNVPVDWYEYNPLIAESKVAISQIKEANKTGENIEIKNIKQRYHNFASCYLNNEDCNEEFANLFAKYVDLTYNKI